MSAYYTSMSGMLGFQSAVDTVAHNLANARTAGYKASDVQFRDLMTQAMDAKPKGLGTMSPAAVRVFRQGALEFSPSPLDAALSGNGFFVATDAAGQPAYTRGGSFRVGPDAAGVRHLTLPDGSRVQGFGAGAAVAADIVLPQGRPPAATTAIRLLGNVSAELPVGESTGFLATVYDAAGVGRTFRLTVQREAGNAWRLTGSVDGQPAGESLVGSTPDGRFLTPPLGFAGGGVGPFTVSFESVTLFGGDSDFASSQDGRAAAPVAGYSIADGGLVLAHFGDGDVQTVAQLAVARVANPQGLRALNGGMYTLTPESGEAELLTGPNAGVEILGGMLEQSTTDLAREFTKLIVFQRGYQANSRAFLVSDQMREDLNQIIR
ncbi:MAG: flagellar hook-basal body complex protein [Bryobacterales bacterium]|nr:flagellar hook-basal body complex protein [Bryobacterales bacterium]